MKVFHCLAILPIGPFIYYVSNFFSTTKFSCCSLKIYHIKKKKYAQKIRENVEIDKKIAYIIYEWSLTISGAKHP